MKYTRIYADEAGESHFEDVEIKLTQVNFAPPAPPLNLSSFVTKYFMSLLSLITALFPHISDRFSFSRPSILFCL